MIHRTIICAALLMSLVPSASAQLICMKRKELEKHKFAASTTYIQLFGNDTVDKALREAVQAEWTVTKFEFVPEGQSLGDRSDPSRSFISVYNMEGVDAYFALSQGNKEWFQPSKVTSYGMMTDHYRILIAGYAMDKQGTEKALVPAAWRVPLMIHGLQTAVRGILDGADVPMTIPWGYSDARTVPVSGVAGKTLLIPADRFSAEEQTILRNNFTHKLEFCDAPRLQEVIAAKDPGYVVLSFAVSISGYALIFDAATYDCFFSETDVWKEQLKASTVKKMSKAFDG